MFDTVIQNVDTSHGNLVAEMTLGKGLDVVLIHGNSSCRRVFHRQLNSHLGRDHRLICIDLPGHGQSDDAEVKERTYPLPGLADACIELLEKLDLKRPVLVGWSLGGHVAIEVAARSYPLRGLFLTGTSPVGPDISEGFSGGLLKGLASRGKFTELEAMQFVNRVFGDEATYQLEQAAMRTDLSFRTILFSAARITEKSNQRAIVSSITIPTAIVNGADDSIINLDYVDSVPYSKLWKGTCFRIPRAGHAPFLQNSEEFNGYLERFLEDI